MAQTKSQVEETLRRLGEHQGVTAALITNKEGAILKTVGLTEVAEQCSLLLPQLTDLARNVVRDIDPTNDLEFLRLRCKKHELMVAAGADFNLIVVQELPASDPAQR